MNYQRPLQRTAGPKKFSVGTHQAKITKVQKKKSRKNNDMFTIYLEGTNGERGVFYLTFGNEYTDENLNFLIASIEDNGVDIPDLDFGFNKDTFLFLHNKDVFIKVEMKPFNGETKEAVTQFLTLDEFENSIPLEEINTTWENE
ncbi:MAG: type III secretion system protein PrgE [Enterococcus sp.]|nr:type III secretion system protein PrgE [Enterococcus sp.]